MSKDDDYIEVWYDISPQCKFECNFPFHAYSIPIIPKIMRYDSKSPYMLLNIYK